MLELPERYEPLRAWFEAHRRDAWAPVVRDEPFDALTSHLGGPMWMADGESWPTCGVCENALWPILQLVSQELPASVGGQALQLFACAEDAECLDVHEYGEPFSDCVLRRLVDPAASGGSLRRLVRTAGYDVDFVVPRDLRIVGWERFDDYPGSFEAESLGLVESMTGGTFHWTWPDRGVRIAIERHDDEALPWAREVLKLGGWASHGNRFDGHPTCPTCGAVMDRVLFQLPAGDEVPLGLGDMGVGQIVACPVHAGVLAFPFASG